MYFQNKYIGPLPVQMFLLGEMRRPVTTVDSSDEIEQISRGNSQEAIPEGHVSVPGSVRGSGSDERRLNSRANTTLRVFTPSFHWSVCCD